MSQSQPRVRPQPTATTPSLRGSATRASTTVVTALARADDVNPTELEVTLYDVIDPDALDALFADRNDDTIDVEVEFEVAEYLVTVRGPDHVLVRPV